MRPDEGVLRADSLNSCARSGKMEELTINHSIQPPTHRQTPMELTVAEALQQGIKAHKAGQFQEAEQLYRAILTTQPQHTDAHHNLGVLAVQFGKLTEAVPFFEEALKANPTIAQYWVSYLDVLLKLERLNEAEQALAGARWWKIRGPKLYRVDPSSITQINNRNNRSLYLGYGGFLPV